MEETHLSHYRIVELLGKGGMGEVYRAEDSKLGREVALKILPPELATHQERLERFRREARTLAALDHPNIVHVYSVEEVDGVHFLTMQLVRGQQLSNRLVTGGMSLEDFFAVAVPLVDALASAHEQGITHRDLKPANVMIDEEGRVKVLDFGLAKLGPTGPEAGASQLPTEAITEEGLVVGTVPYMSPEQAEGTEVDHRSDVFSLGIVLYQMATGRAPFEGDTPLSVLSAILRESPKPVEQINSGVPRHLGRIVRKCLEKDRARRYQSTRDLYNDLADLSREVESGDGEPSGSEVAPASRFRWPIYLLATAALGVLAILLWRWADDGVSADESRIVRFPLFADPDEPTGSFGPTWRLSPDDRFFAYQTVSRPGAPPSAIHLRSFGDGTVRELRGTEGARSMTFSPDGGQIAFFDEGILKRVSLQDGTVEAIATLDYEHQVGLAWTDEGFLAITSWIPRGLWRVHATGGELEGLTFRDRESPQYGTNEIPFFPNDLPGRRFILFTLRRLPSEDHLEILSLDAGDRRTVSNVGSRGAFVPPGFVAYYHQGKLFAFPFDPASGRVEGEAVAVLDGVRSGMFSVSRSGSLAYAPGEERGTLAVARPGSEPEPLPVSVHRLVGPRVSPDGKRVVFASDEGSDRANLWLFDLERETTRRITGEEGNEWWSAWGPDGRLAFQSDREDNAFLDLYVMDPDRPDSTRKVLDGGECYLQPQEWSPDGLLLYQRSCVGSGTLDIFTLDVDSGDTQALRENKAREKHPSISPDGRWLAFASNLSGEDQVYLTTYPGPGRLTQVSPAGGDGPIWTPAGDGLFFHSAGDLVFVPFDGEAANPLGTPEIAVPGVPGNAYIGRAYDLFPDGGILLRLSAPVPEVRVVLNWNREVARKLGRR